MNALVYSEYESVCHLCGRYIEVEDRSVDHVIPRSKGGTNELINLRPCHQRCNSRRGDKDVEAYRSTITDARGWFFNLEA
jgi:5-methylcytosine-specific restriction endonuclease McrA